MKHRRPSDVVVQPAVSQLLKHGISKITGAVRPTLGPMPRVVAIERPSRGIAPELIDNGGLTAQRITALPDRDENVGAMLLRSLMMRQRDDHGDGTTTAAVLFETVYDHGLKAIAAGADPSRLRVHLKRVCSLVLEELSEQTIRLTSKADLIRTAEAIGTDAELAQMLGEVFDVIGEYGLLEFRDNNSRDLRCEYVEGSYWRSQIASSSMIAGQAWRRTQLQRPAIIMSDLEITDGAALANVIDLTRAGQDRTILVIGRSFSDRALALLLANGRSNGHQIVAMRTPGASDDDRQAVLTDLARLVGGRPLLQAAGDALSGIRVEDLGFSQRAWATAEAFGIIAGKGNPKALRQHLVCLRGLLEQSADANARHRLRERIGRLMGGAATLWVGAATEAEAKLRRSRAERAAQILRGILEAGVVPGGGVAFHACREVVRAQMEQTCDADEYAACQIVHKALDAPIRSIIENVGGDVDQVMATIVQAGPNHGFDGRTREVVNMIDAQIYDSTSVQRAAAHGAIVTAALALTIDVIVHGNESSSSSPASE